MLELHRTDVIERRMQPAMIIEAHPVDHLVHRRAAGREPRPVQARHHNSAAASCLALGEST